MKDIKDMNLAQLAEKVRWLEYCVNGCVIEISDRLYELNEQHRWIPVSERMPTEEDANHEGNVLGLSNEGDVWVPHITSVQAGYGYKAWKRITPPEDKP